MRISDWSSDVCSSDLRGRLFSFGNERAAALGVPRAGAPPGEGRGARRVKSSPSGSGDRCAMWHTSREDRYPLGVRRCGAKKKECSYELSLLAWLVTDRLPGAGDEPAETRKGDRDQSMEGKGRKMGDAV